MRQLRPPGIKLGTTKKPPGPKVRPGPKEW
jgi:hypothetical protein